MRKGILIFLLINITIVTYLVYSVWTLLTLLIVDGSSDAISRAEIPGPGASDPFNGRKQLIPKIIHQTYANTNLPEHWRVASDSCRTIHKDYKYNVSSLKHLGCALGHATRTDWPIALDRQERKRIHCRRVCILHPFA